MLKLKEELAIENESIQQQLQSDAASENQTKEEGLQYHYTRFNKAKVIEKELHCTIVTILAIIVFFSFVTYCSMLAVKYAIAATRNYGNYEYCSSSKIYSNGWNFYYSCLACQEGYQMKHHNECVLKE